MSYRNNIEQQNLLNQFLKENGVELPGETLGKLYDYADLVVETKQFGNLISAKDSEKFLSRHIADSLVAYVYTVRECKEIPALVRLRSPQVAGMTNGEPGIRPMEPLQPSKFRRENARKRATDERRKAAPGAHPDKPSKASESKLADLERQMKEAAARLDFEEAARIRDIIRSLDA